MKIIIPPCILFSLLLINPCLLKAQVAAVSFSHSNANPSPSEIISRMECHRKNDRVYLQWSLFDNRDIKHIEVQASRDGKVFVMAGIVFTSEGNEALDYQFYEKIRPGKYVYRIKLVLQNDSQVYSPAVSPEAVTTIQL